MLVSSVDIAKYKKMQSAPFYRMRGKVVNVIGLTIESAGPDAKLGDICLIYPKKKYKVSGNHSFKQCATNIQKNNYL